MNKTRKLIIAKRGSQYMALKLNDIAFFTTVDKLVYAVDAQGRKYMVQQRLNELVEELDNTAFFRVNRQYLVNAFYIKSFRPHKKVQLQLELEMENLKEEILVSQLSTPAFREWINNI